MTKTILTSKSLFSNLSAPTESLIDNAITIPLILTEENQLHYTDTYINLCEQVVDRMFDSNKPAELFLCIKDKNDNSIYLYSGNYIYYICVKVPTYDDLTDTQDFEYAFEEIELDDDEIGFINEYLAGHKDNKRFLREKCRDFLIQDIRKHNMHLFLDEYVEDENENCYKATWTSNIKPVSICVTAFENGEVFTPYVLKFGC